MNPEFKQYSNGRWYIRYADNDGNENIVSEAGFATRLEAENWWADNKQEVI
jgi:hypothetical protein